MRKPRKRRPAKTQKRDPAQTLTRLLDAAEREFNARGFEGTDTNRIARAAGYAPQTFYRHFADKTAVFLAVYERWWRSEVSALERVEESATPDAEAAARVAIAFHTKWRGFRRSLRHLAIVEPRVRKARTAARLAQIARVRQGRSDGELIGALLAAERLCDAVAEGEMTDLGAPMEVQRALVAEAVATLIGLGLSSRGRRSKTP